MSQPLVADVTGATTAVGEVKQTDTVSSPEKVTTEANKPSEDTEAMSPKFAALARKEKLIRQKEQTIKAKEAELEKTLLARQSEFEQSWKARLAKDPLTVMNESGLSYEQLTNAILNQPTPSDHRVMSLEKEIESLKKTIEGINKTGEDAKVQQREQAKIQIGREITKVVSMSEEFEALKSYGAQGVSEVVKLIETNFNETGELMDYDEACRQIENELVDEAMKVAQWKKVQSKLAQASAPTPKQEPPHTGKQPIQTLSNNLNQTASRPLSARERRERAIAAFNGKQI